MKLWAALANAFAGWVKIARGDADWRIHFAFTAPGLVTAILIYFFFAFLAVAFCLDEYRHAGPARHCQRSSCRACRWPRSPLPFRAPRPCSNPPNPCSI
ncbi:hypothetical protein N8D56_00545 [Devosia sp. A8/3-2]|nr:hypothetical protein N8D56_00545 [Devosia sp. A8/3-2]